MVRSPAVCDCECSLGLCWAGSVQLFAEGGTEQFLLWHKPNSCRLSLLSHVTQEKAASPFLPLLWRQTKLFELIKYFLNMCERGAEAV